MTGPEQPNDSVVSAQDKGAEETTDRAAMRRDLLAAIVIVVVSLLLIGFLWLISREAPSAGRDPDMTPLVPVATRVPTVAPTPVPAATP